MRILLSLLFLVFFLISGYAQESGHLSLQADELIYSDTDSRIIARGNVILEYQGNRVTADELTYDQSSRRVQASGSVELLDNGGDRLVADNLDLTDDFSAGFISSLEIETTDKTYFSATHAEQLDGSTIFHNGVYTPCEPCADDPQKPVTWRIKADKITINGIDNTISYKDAQFEFLGIPLISIESFSHSDPSQTRKDGFLVPDVKFSDELGTSYHQSYFKTLGKSSDIKLSLASYSVQGFLGRADWRQQYSTGSVAATIAVIDQESPDKFDNPPDNLESTRTMFATKGDFAISDRWTTGWSAFLQSDDSFANTYQLDGYSDTTITNQVYLSGLGDRSSFSLAGYYYDVQGIDSYQEEAEQAQIHPVLDYHRITTPENLGGELSLSLNMTSLSRTELSSYTSVPISSGLIDNLNRPLTDIDRRGPNNRAYRIHGIDGNYTRLSADIEWRKSLIHSGFSLIPSLGIHADTLTLRNNNNYEIYNLSQAQESRLMPKAALDISYPLLVTTASSHHIIEPLGQLIVRSELDSIGPLPNEDSQSLVFDASSLFSHDKFSGYDRIESGIRANYGIRYSGTYGSDYHVTGLFGQSYHLDGDNPFEQDDLTNTGIESGLESARSDYVAALSLGLPIMSDITPHLHFQGRFAEAGFHTRRMDSTLHLDSSRWSVSGQYAYIDGQPLSGFARTREQFSLASDLNIISDWSIFAGTSYDLENDNFISDMFGVGYDDSCLSFSLTLSQTRDLYNPIQSDRSIVFKLRLRALAEFEGEN